MMSEHFGRIEGDVEKKNVHPNPSAEDLERLHHSMVLEQIIGRGITCEHTISAMKAVPRHHFLPDSMNGVAYDDCPHSIGLGQTISQPYMVALMTSQFGHLPKGVVYWKSVLDAVIRQRF